MSKGDVVVTRRECPSRDETIVIDSDDCMQC